MCENIFRVVPLIPGNSRVDYLKVYLHMINRSIDKTKSTFLVIIRLSVFQIEI